MKLWNAIKAYFAQKQDPWVAMDPPPGRFNPKPPCLEEIENRMSVPDIYVCRHFSRDAYKCLNLHGYNVRVVRGPANGWEKEYHCWIEMVDDRDGVVYWYDPTWYKYDHAKYGCHPAKEWTDRRAVPLPLKLNGGIIMAEAESWETFFVKH